MKQLSLMNVTTASERAPVLIGCLTGKPKCRYEVDRVAIRGEGHEDAAVADRFAALVLELGSGECRKQVAHAIAERRVLVGMGLVGGAHSSSSVRNSTLPPS